MSDDHTTRSTSGAAVAEPAVDVPASRGSRQDNCPACGSEAYSSLLSPQCDQGPRALVSCSRCGFLRFLSEPLRDDQCPFGSFFVKRVAANTLGGRLLESFRALASVGPERFLLQGSGKRAEPERVLVVDALDGTFSRSVQRDGVRCIALTDTLEGASHATHRQGVASVVAVAGAPPFLPGTADKVARVRGFAREKDPVGWLMQVNSLIRPDGKIVVQVFDCASWAFLLCGSRWVGLATNEARFAYRAEDLEILMDLCGLRIVRRSHFFPLLNACAWASSILGRSDVIRPGWTSQAPPALGHVLLYLLFVVALLPLAVAEGLCHAGSVMLLEAERKR